MMENEYIKKAVDELAREVFGMTKDDAHLKGICVACGADIFDFDDELSEREYKISGLCQKCQNEFFEEE